MMFGFCCCGACAKAGTVIAAESQSRGPDQRRAGSTQNARSLFMQLFLSE